MHRQLIGFIGLSISLAFSQNVWADTERVYVPLGSVDPEQVVSAPPASGSAEFEQGMAIVLWMQRVRTPEQIVFVQKSLGVERFAEMLRGELFRVNGELLKSTIDDAVNEVRADYDRLKQQYDVPRPFQVSSAVEPATDWRPVKSFPSGHSVRAVVYARLLGEFFPEQRDAMLRYAEQIAYGRVLAGVHFPTDVLAGMALGHAYADVILQQDAFKQIAARIEQPSSNGD
ncbi:MAG: phosphatase PAP2 family protein [Pseudomonadota bacterium]